MVLTVEWNIGLWFLGLFDVDVRLFVQFSGVEIDKAFGKEFHDFSGSSADAFKEPFALRSYCLDGGFGAGDHFYCR